MSREESFKPTINRRSALICKTQLPIFSDERYNEEIKQRERKHFEAEQARKLKEREAQENEEREMARYHSSGKKVTDLEKFNRKYHEQLEKQAARKRELEAQYAAK
jgi:hypothetical protein